MKTIVITGSSKGIGLGLAKQFLKKGHNVVFNARNEESLLKELNSLKEYENHIDYHIGDISKTSHIKALLKKANERFSKVDIWINNAGIPQSYSNFISLKDSEIENLININVIGLMKANRIVAEFMSTQGHGKIFNMEGFGSDGRMMEKLTLYGTSKRAVNYFTKSISREIDSSKIQIGILSPGMVRTDFLEVGKGEMGEKEMKRYERVVKILAEDVDTVAEYLSDKTLKSTKNYDRINFLSGWTLFSKIFRLSLGF